MTSPLKTARLKLTLQYSFIILVIGLLFSSLFYLRTTRVIQLEYDRLNQRFQREEQGFIPPPGMMLRRRITPEDLSSASRRLLSQLILINALVITITSGFGYLLSGFTLKPIQLILDEQKRFIADAAHELKTPLTALKTTLEVNLMDQKLTAKIKKILYENLADVINLQRLTENLLQLANADSAPVSLQPLILEPIIKQALKKIRVLAAKKKINLVSNFPEFPIFVLGQSDSLIELTLIFLDNAVKFSPENSTIWVTLEKLPKAAQIKIKDQGVGISENDQKHIFQRFYQADASRSKNNSNGFGLGLALAEKIVERHRGKITLRSTVNHGSSFSITLPLAPSQ